MSDDFCLIHGYEHMRRRFGDPIPYCDECDRQRDAAGRRAKSPASVGRDAERVEGPHAVCKELDSR